MGKGQKQSKFELHWNQWDHCNTKHITVEQQLIHIITMKNSEKDLSIGNNTIYMILQYGNKKTNLK